MATVSSFISTFITVLILGFLLCSPHQGNAQGCRGNLSELVSQCSPYVQRPGPLVSPSRGCCAVVNGVDVPCVCGYVNKQVESVISMQKVVFVARSCGKAVPPGMKCGSYTVPNE